MPRTGLYVLQGVEPAEIAAAPFDVKVIDIYNDNGALFTPAQVHQMGGGAGSGLLLGYFSIGEAETYRDYYATIPGAAIGPENPQWKGNFEVAYWTPEWKQVAVAYIDKMITAGYDGVYFDVVDAYQNAWAKTTAPGGAAGAETAMVDLIKYLHGYAEAKQPGFKVWVNNAEELLKHPDYVEAIDGMFKENPFYTDSGQKQPASETRDSLALLNKAIAAGKDVISIEYVTGAETIADVHAQAEKAGIGNYVAHLELNGVDLEGVAPGQVLHPDTGGSAVPPASEPAPEPSPNPTPTPAPKPPASHDILGTDGRDDLVGTSKADTIDGGKGHDRLTGDDGSDTFVLRHVGRSDADVITDFKHGTDKLALDHARMTSLRATGGEIDPTQFTTGSHAHDASDHVLYDRSSGRLFYDPDGPGGAPVTLIATLDNHAKLDAHDLLIV